MKPSLFVKEGGLHTFSGQALTDLLQAVLGRGVPFRFQAKGGSMRPLIRDGDVITVSPLGDSPLTRGDVVAFIHPESERLVVHRILSRQGSTCAIRGDNTSAIDGCVPVTRILGRVTRVEREGRAIGLGLGRERCLIAWATRWGLMPFFLAPLWRRFKPLLRFSGRRLW